MTKFIFDSTFDYKLIYIFRINDETHKGYLKIGDATIHTNKKYTDLQPNCRDLNCAAKQRIDSYTRTAAISYDLLWTEIAVYMETNLSSKKYGRLLAFRDYDVHNVLKRSGIPNKQLISQTKQNEWFECDLETAKKAIQAVKQGKSSLDNRDISTGRNLIVFRPEQQEAIEKTLNQYKVGNRMLWNAKMRFGKTLTALEVVKRSKFERTIIITHRPVVSQGWFDDFAKIFYDSPDYEFGSKTRGKSIEELEASGKKYVYFASMQDLRGSEQVGGNFDKNDIIFKINWDLVVVDEAHEGTQTELGHNVLQNVIKPEDKEHVTKTLELSGTPFNLLIDYADSEIYTWDYIMEQEAKQKWTIDHFGDSNPYEELPKLNIFTYHLEKTFQNYMDFEEKAFNFREFFRTWTGDINKDYEHIPAGKNVGNFVHEEDVRSFLNLICKESSDTNYPFSTEKYRNFFRHTLWILPGVKEAKAFSRLLKSHPVFSQFEIVNVAGDGDEEINSQNALDAVQKAIGNDADKTRTITLSCGRLTTGVSVPEWTAVMMLAGSYSTQASQYLQTIFRVQTPANINGRIKENCYVFDFAPDRTLKIVAESVQLSQRGTGSHTSEARLQKFLNYCPVISIDGTGMKKYQVSYLLQELKKAYAERVVKNGFDDPELYNDQLLKLTEADIEDLSRLKAIIGSSKAQEKTKEIDINDEGFTEEEYERIQKAQNKPRKELTDEEKAALEELKKKRELKAKAISILRGISIRIPLLVYGADIPITEEITIQSFPDLVDDLSWEEFMPKGVTKADFKLFSKYYDKDVFISSTTKVRNMARAADDLEPTDRVKKLAKIFSTFKNPDKETVLTPWRVVNMHMSETIGGYDFWGEDHLTEIENPRFVEQDGTTKNIFDNPKGKVLEINSKTGLYPLYIAYTYYREKCKEYEEDQLTFENKKKIWDEVIRDNIYVICKTPMAKSISQRTLMGYRNGKINAHAFDDLINQLKSKQQQFVNKVTSCKFWNKEGKKMKFSCVVGNPPYQVKTSDLTDQQNASPVYNYFVTSSIRLNPNFVSLIIPSRWMTGGRGLDEFRQRMLSDKSLKIIHDYLDARDCFSNVEIKGGVCYFLWDKEYSGPVRYFQHKDNSIEVYYRSLNDLNVGMFVRDTKALSIINKVINSKDFISFEKIAGSQTPFGIVTSFKDYSLSPTSEYTMKIYGNKFEGYTSMKFVTKNAYLAYKFKVFAPKAVGNGDISTDKIHPFVPDNPSICTQTYIIYGEFDEKNSADNLCEYMKTKFFHFLLGQLKNTQQMAPNLFKFVPLLDFSQKWTDQRLYQKYGLSSDEIEYIESTVWPSAVNP